MGALIVVISVLLLYVTYDRYQIKKHAEEQEFLLWERKVRDLEAVNKLFTSRINLIMIDEEHKRQDLELALNILTERYKKDTRFRVWLCVTDKIGIPNKIVMIASDETRCEEVLYKELNVPKGTYIISEIPRDKCGIILMNYDIL